MSVAIPFQKSKVGFPVAVLKKHACAAVPALGDGIWNLWNDHSCKTCHVSKTSAIKPPPSSVLRPVPLFKQFRTRNLTRTDKLRKHLLLLSTNKPYHGCPFNRNASGSH